ncbi:uncharacterized protein LACBIDRAFT_329328 [Laccaria bicolor S238N-H82]|uniref:Predicted protein n=1 Tax=Laccaria bicolor (strain S238N-H82 / ATCC MYA-4686) TaxID=486041 RepID=B0DHP4_LACBS|nr:uncharacterized protein LACBIDRAFT_329328 [Laccaria bicolor S238N-H82]EDR05762.1 predicted protein [Laccaria bicolor S238N-H82]|eukprot:XP_001883438.1 predicted protein [Laccaria bicolor S238N-H82]
MVWNTTRAPLKLNLRNKTNCLLCINVYTAQKDEEMTKRFSSSANSLEASVCESLDEPHVLLLSLVHVLTCVVFTDVSWVRHSEGDGIDVGRIGSWHGDGPVDDFDERGEPQKVVVVIGEGRSEVTAANSQWFLLRKT